MNDHTVLLIIVLFSLIATTAIWIRVLKQQGNFWFKLLCLVVSVIPFFGPIFYLLIDAPSTLPPSEQGKQIPKGTEVYPSFKPLIKTIRKILGAKIR